jgi:hypothetical protein
VDRPLKAKAAATIATVITHTLANFKVPDIIVLSAGEALSAALGSRFHPEVEQAAQGFGARGLVRLARSPSFDFRDLLLRKAKRHHRVLPRSRAARTFSYYDFP